MMRESCQIDAVFLRLELLELCPILAIVDLKCLVVARNNAEFARVVEVEGSHCVWSFIFARSESLEFKQGQSCEASFVSDSK